MRKGRRDGRSNEEEGALRRKKQRGVSSDVEEGMTRTFQSYFSIFTDNYKFYHRYLLVMLMGLISVPSRVFWSSGGKAVMCFLAQFF